MTLSKHRRAELLHFVQDRALESTASGIPASVRDAYRDLETLLRNFPDVAADEVLVALKRGEGYEDVHPQLVAQDAQICWPEWRTITQERPR